ncbi:MAG: vitamin K epoxide reductase family protein [Cyanobacteriota bacterium]|nr:vitamin K epoxide reductase family protein [Cyanobacteriota bacterium]
MRRRRQETRWINRHSRGLLAGIAGLGLLDTAYLLFIRWTGGAACPTEGCNLVLSSPYATILGLPLALFGLLGYLAILALATAPWWVKPEQNKVLRQQLEDRTWPLLFGLTTAMVVFSAYLMSVMAFEIKAFCPFCVASALFALSLFLITLFGHRWEDRGQLFFIAAIIGVVTLTSVFALYAPARSGGTATGGQAGPPIIQTSGPAELALAQHLKASGAVMYGAWWCPHCHEQKELFGAEAAQLLPYVECAEDGIKPQTDLCRSKPEIKGFPTWEVKGQFYSGSQSLEQLAELSDYAGSKNFRQ